MQGVGNAPLEQGLTDCGQLFENICWWQGYLRFGQVSPLNVAHCCGLMGGDLAEAGKVLSGGEVVEPLGHFV